MAFRHGKSTALWYNGANLTSYLNEASVSQDVETAETTAFGNDAKTYITGLKDGTLSGSGMFDGSAGAVDETLSGVIGATAADVVTLAPDGPVAGRRAYSLQARETSYEISSPVSDVVSISLEVQADGGVGRGILLAANESVSTSGQSVSQDELAATSNGGTAYLHVTANTRDGASIFKVQHSSDNVTFVDLATFTSVSASATGGQVIAITGSVYRYVRTDYAPGGSAGAVTHTIALTRNL
jgi:hypothetical protein